MDVVKTHQLTLVRDGERKVLDRISFNSRLGHPNLPFSVSCLEVGSFYLRPGDHVYVEDVKVYEDEVC